MRARRHTILAVAVAAALAGCGGDNDAEEDPSAPLDDDRPAQTEPPPSESKRGTDGD